MKLLRKHNHVHYPDLNHRSVFSIISTTQAQHVLTIDYLVDYYTDELDWFIETVLIHSCMSRLKYIKT